MSESTEKVSNEILEQRKGRFFIRESYIDETTQEMFWVVSTIRDDDPQQEFSVTVDRNNPKMQEIMRNMDSSIMDLSKLHLVRTAANPRWQVASATEVMEPKDRKIVEKSGVHRSDWTPDLGDSVEKYCEYRIFEKASDIKKDLYGSPEMMEDIKSHTEGFFGFKAKEIFPDITDAEIQEFIQEAREPDSIHRNSTFNDLMAGREVGPDDEVRRVFYHTDYPASDQIHMEGSREVALSGLYNYAAQNSCANLIRARVIAAGPKDSGLLENYELQLKKMKALVATHPTRTHEDYRILTSEFAELISGESVRSQMAACGAKAANPAYDDVNISMDTKLSGRGQDDTFGNEICRKAMKDFESSKNEMKDPFLEYLNMEGRNAYKYAVTAKRDVEVAQDSAMAHGQERVPSRNFDTRQIKETASKATSKVLDLMDELDSSF